ncbi:MAG TPA: LacI family DNA-binding transcriptional regulator, partial [Casimicrobiaceae bacterium]|nr:LacI family DNA-binding transcriptional regulator [Casimicrobiaceae bacterium]
MSDHDLGLRATASRVPSRASAKDVARLAGVSTATVSRALNLPDQLDPHTLVRVRAAIDKLRYVPHGAARALRSQRSQMVGAVVPSFAYALYARTTSAMQSVLDPGGYAMVLAEHHYDLAAEVRITEQLVSRGVDAFVF